MRTSVAVNMCINCIFLINSKMLLVSHNMEENFGSRIFCWQKNSIFVNRHRNNLNTNTLRHMTTRQINNFLCINILYSPMSVPEITAEQRGGHKAIDGILRKWHGNWQYTCKINCTVVSEIHCAITTACLFGAPVSDPGLPFPLSAIPNFHHSPGRNQA